MAITAHIPETIAALEAHGRALVALAGNLRQATALQWDKAPRLAPSVDRTHVGGADDPTPVIAGDEYRLKVRAAILTAETALATSADALNEASAGLERAVDCWQGGRNRAPRTPTGIR